MEEIFRFLEKTLVGMDKQVQIRIWLWATEMCIRYNKKPKEVVKLMKEMLKELKNLPSKEVNYG